MKDEQCEFVFDEDFDSLLTNLDDVTNDRAVAEKRYKQHLWELVLITERRLQDEGFAKDDAYKMACKLIAEIAHYEGGEMRYLPRGERLKQELRDIQIFKLWHIESWPVDKIHKQFCPDLNIIEVYKIIRVRTQTYRASIQPKLL